MIMAMTGCTNVPPGYTGIKVFLNGGDKGVDSQVLGVGRYWIGINEQLFLFPTFTQNHIWTRAVTEGSPNNDSFTFQTKQGLSVNTDVGIAYHIEGDKVTNIFQKYRKGTEEITNLVLRNTVRDALNKAGSTKDIEAVYGEGKADLMEEVLKIVRSEINPVGINVENVYLVGEMRLPQTVITAINNKANASQLTEQRRQEVEQVKLEAEKAVAVAQGEANSKLAIAKANAEAINFEGEALKNNPQVLELRKVEKWNGGLPQYMTGAIPFVNVQK